MMKMMKKAVCWMMVFATMISFAACRNETVDPTKVPDATNEVMYSGGETTSPTDGTEETKWYEGGNGEEIVITMPPSDGGEDIIPPGWEDDDTPVSDATQPPKQDDTPVKETTPPATEPPATQPPKQNDTPKETEPPATSPSGHVHTFVEWETEPSCDGWGAIWIRCSECGYFLSAGDEVTEPPLGHNYVDGICTRCGRADPDTVEEIDYEDIGKAAMKYINQYRVQEGSSQLTWLPGMSQVAQYRSVQLTTNFAHDTDDIREAHAYYEYGRYIDWAECGCPELVDENYYTSDSGEAIGWGVRGTTADAIGKDIADLFYNSSGHWSYVGSSDYSYIGVGFTDGYVCVMVGRVNYG